MSSFKTSLKLDPRQVIRELPSGASVEGVEWKPDTQELEIVWNHHELVTPFTFALDYPLSMLQAKELPKDTRWKRPASSVHAPPPAPPAPPPAPPTDSQPATVRKSRKKGLRITAK